MSTEEYRPIVLAAATKNSRGSWDLAVEACPRCGKPTNHTAVDKDGRPDLDDMPYRLCKNKGCWQSFELRPVIVEVAGAPVPS